MRIKFKYDAEQNFPILAGDYDLVTALDIFKTKMLDYISSANFS